MSTKRKVLVAAFVLAALAALAAWRFTPSEVPPGQPPLVTLEAASLETLRGDFNRHADDVRVIVLLSPT